jgi:hypothetical protein
VVRGGLVRRSQPAGDLEFPRSVLRRCLEHYRAGLEGERGEFRFASYGNAYSVDTVPVRGDEQKVVTMLGIAVPAQPPAVGCGAPPVTRGPTGSATGPMAAGTAR